MIKKSLLTEYPEIAQTWDYEKNGDLKPDDVAPHSNKKAWWICDKGHSWYAMIGNRTRWSGCPYCSGRAVCDDNSLANRFPDIVKEWNYSKNVKYSPDNITCFSQKKVWWVCEKGHEWEASISSRTYMKSCCPFCSNQRVLKGYNDLATTNPEISKEWNFSRNDLGPDSFVYGSVKKVWWICDKGHEWEATINSRAQGHNCPYCAGLLVTKETSLLGRFPDIAKMYFAEKNSIPVDKIAPMSSKRVWWKCEKGHEWNTRVSDLTAKGCGCPYCSGRRISKEYNLAALYPNVCKEWNYEKNKILPDKVSPYSQKKVWWKCSYGHEWEAVIGNRTTNATGCPYCNNRSTSFPEQAILFYCKKYFDKVLSRDTDTIGEELDIFIPSINTAIEYDGERWHRDASVKEKEQLKDHLCIEKSIRLIRVLEGKVDNTHDKDITCIRVKKNNNPSLTLALKELFNLLGITDCDINLKRDIHSIKEQYTILPVENSFGSEYPDIAKTWDYEKNGSLTPFMFTSGSNHRAWWKCDKGHSWQSTIGIRTGGSNCPYCNKKIASPENNLSVKYPDIAAEWNYEKNKGLLPTDVTPYTFRKVWWRCANGHEWDMPINHRTKSNCNCPYCSGRRVNDETSFQTLFPEIAIEWDYTKNGDDSPNNYTRGSSKVAWWLCPKGHSYDLAISQRAQGQSCPYCAGKRVLESESFGAMFPDIAKEWDYIKNKDITPFTTTPSSSKKVWWICDKGHSFAATVANRTNRGSKCPYCQGRAVCSDNCLSTLCPEIAIEWDYDKNAPLTPNDVTIGSQKSVWWKCKKGHEWNESIFHRTRRKDHTCPLCRSER